ncbi:mas-related G-protein coupled receptor member H-like protein [Turdus rufiventris]|nr:mas-related G-protein coupled receptor member H-like protein [Turdus rufiventris]
MEVTTVSPSPASPNEGDDLCETDGTNVAIHIVTLLISLCGLVGNGAVLCLLSLKSRTYAIFYMAVADFLFLLFTVPSALLFLVEDLSCSPVVPLIYLSFIFQLSVVSFFWTLYQLMLSSSAVDMYNLLQLCCPGNLPGGLLLLVDRVQDWVFFAFFPVIPMLIFRCPSQKRGQCKAGLISMYAVILLLFVAPVVITRTNDIFKAKTGSRKQKLKRRHIVFSLVVLVTLLLGLCNILQQLRYFPVSSEVVFLLTCIHSSIKPFIYFLAGRCSSPCSMKSLQLSLQRVFEEEKENTAHRDDDNSETVI